MRHQNFVESVRSMTNIGALNEKDIVGQVARCSFDVHILDIMASLMVGATIVMLHPNGIFDFNYLSVTLQRKQITYMDATPTFYNHFLTWIHGLLSKDTMRFLRSVISGGM